MKRLLAILIAGTMQFSVCTGGIVSVAAAFTGNITQQLTSGDIVMTPAFNDRVLCQSLTPAPETTTVVTAATGPAMECGSDDTCFLQAFSRLDERLSTVLTAWEAMAIPRASASEPVITNREQLVTHDHSPPHKGLKLLRTTVKQE